ncbi:MAG: radical SAM protein [Candidatus Omnitrophica bacterium]|nr:radical SAM protein [Candidatus Omnitrophota bacterium]MDD5430159.1 radical SAM protein [Candidatus Omnitrophota bacterium]
MTFKTDVIKLLVNYFYKPISPIEVILYLTNKCNLKCKFCDIGIANIKKEPHPYRELSLLQLDKIVKAMVALKVEKAYITGGEPFLAENLWYFLDLCCRNSRQISGITTNGNTLNALTKEQVDILNYAKTRRIIISVDYASADKHDAFRGRVGLFRDIETFLVSEKSDRIKSNYWISTVISKDNYKELPELIKWAATINKIRHINFQPVCVEPIFVDYKRCKTSQDALYASAAFLNELETYISAALKTAEDYGMSTSLPFLKLWIKEYFKYAKTEEYFFKKVMKGFICSRPYNYLSVNYNGDILACTHIGPTGSIDKGDIISVWRQSAEKYRKSFKKGVYFEKCKSCFCDFGSNYRASLLYEPMKNIKHVFAVIPYYINRLLKKTN